MKVTGSTIQQLEKDKPKSRCRKWRLWATTDEGRKSRRFNGTWTEAQEALEAFVDGLRGFVPNSESFAAYARSWRLLRAQSGDYSPNTLAGERTAVNALLRTRLSTMRMDEVDAQACRDALLWLREHPARGGSCKPSTLAKYRQVLHAIMAQAVADGRLAGNPVDAVKPPRQRAVEREALSPGELQLLLNRLDGLPISGHVMACYLMACLGLRCGEACALLDNEADGRYASVSSTVRSADNSIGAPKSAAGKRVLPVPPRLARKVDEWRGFKRLLGHDCPTLCCNRDGNLLTPRAVSDWWAAHRDALGCSNMTLHQLRHSNLSMMARHMSPFDLQRYAGWSSIEPAKVYIHDDLEAVSRAVVDAWSVNGCTKFAPTRLLIIYRCFHRKREICVAQLRSMLLLRVHNRICHAQAKSKHAKRHDYREDNLLHALHILIASMALARSPAKVSLEPPVSLRPIISGYQPPPRMCAA